MRRENAQIKCRHRAVCNQQEFNNTKLPSFTLHRGPGCKEGTDVNLALEHPRGRETVVVARQCPLDDSDVAFLVAPLRDALGQRHSLRGGLLLSTLDGTLCVAASTLERAVLEPGTMRIQKAGHALAEALRFGALARVLAGRTVAAQVGSTEQGLR